MKQRRAENIVVIAGAARSGTSWLGQIFDSVPSVAYRFQPFFSYAFRGRVNADSDAEEWERCFADMLASSDDFLLQSDKREAGIYPSFAKAESADTLCLKTCRYQYLLAGMLHRVPRLKMVGIIRDPRAVLHSWINNDKEFPPGTSVAEHWRYGANKNEGKSSEFFGYYKWKELAHLYLDLAQQNPNRVTLVRYEDLVADAPQETRRLFSFVGLPWSLSTQDFLSDCHSSHQDSRYSVFKRPEVAHRWKHGLPGFIREEVERDLRGTRLEQFLTPEN